MAMAAAAFGASRSIHSHGRNRLPGHRIRAERRPIAFALDLFVRDRAFDDQHKRIDQSLFGLVEIFHEIVADLIGQNRDCAGALSEGRE